MAMGYNGELHESGTRWQLLGNGRRAYNPVLMRFHSPDAMSPFGRGGVNAYGYCAGDPVNFTDPDGTFALPLLMTALGMAGMGVTALAAPAASGGGNGKDGTTAWIIGGVVAAAAVVGLGMMAGKTGAWSTVVKRSARKPGSSSAAPVSVTPTASSSTANAPVQTIGADGSLLYQIDKRDIFTNRKGKLAVHIESLDDAVASKILKIRDFSPGGRTPNAAMIERGNRYRNFEGVLPRRDNQPNMYWEYAITGNGKTGPFARTRVVTARGRPEPGERPRIGMIRVTTTHYQDFLVVQGWENHRMR